MTAVAGAAFVQHGYYQQADVVNRALVVQSVSGFKDGIGYCFGGAISVWTQFLQYLRNVQQTPFAASGRKDAIGEEA